MQTHPSHTSGILLRGLTDLSKEHHTPNNYFNRSYRELYPDIMEDFAYKLKLNPKTPGQNIARTLYKMVKSPNKKTQERAAKIWGNTGGDVMYLNPENHASGHQDTKKQALTLAIIDLHYVVNDYFITQTK